MYICIIHIYIHINIYIVDGMFTTLTVLRTAHFTRALRTKSVVVMTTVVLHTHTVEEKETKLKRWWDWEGEDGQNEYEIKKKEEEAKLEVRIIAKQVIILI